MNEEKLNHFTTTISCKKGTFSFTYLGLALGITKPSLEYFLIMVQGVQRRLCGINDFLNYGGMLQMVKLILISLPILFM
jgi:hypothetical protein